MIKAWEVKYNTEPIYLIYQKAEFFSDMKNITRDPYLLFRPHAFYMTEKDKHNNVNFYGNLEIYEITKTNIKKIVVPNQIGVNWHTNQFSPSDPIITFKELNLKNNQKKLYFVIFTPNDKRRIFKGLFIIDLSFIVLTLLTLLIFIVLSIIYNIVKIF